MVGAIKKREIDFEFHRTKSNIARRICSSISVRHSPFLSAKSHTSILTKAHVQEREKGRQCSLLAVGRQVRAGRVLVVGLLSTSSRQRRRRRVSLRRVDRQLAPSSE